MNGVPNSKPVPAGYIEKFENGDWISKVSQPTLTPYLPDKGTATARRLSYSPEADIWGFQR